MKKIIINLLLVFITAAGFSQKKISALTAEGGSAAGYFIPGSKDGETKKLTAESIAALATAGNVTTTKVTISSAELLALFTIPKTLISAPGAGKMIRTLSCVFVFDYGTTQYSAGQLGVSISGSTLCTYSNFSAAADNTDFRTISTFGTTADLSNTPVILSAASSNPTTGDGTLAVYISYITITL